MSDFQDRTLGSQADLSTDGSRAVSSLSFEKCRILIVDADATVRNDLRELLSAVGYDASAFASPDELVMAENHGSPGCLILDARFRHHSSHDFKKRFFDSADKVPIIFLAAHSDVRMSVDVMKHGAVDFLLKPIRDDEILSAVNVAVLEDNGRRYRNREVTCLRARHHSLTVRERQVMLLATTGHMNKQIAGRLSLSEVTVKIYRRQVMQKMGARSFADLVRMAERLNVGASICFGLTQ
jgi:FixJ family two-component response regulator